jgi:hypothetical protein
MRLLLPVAAFAMIAVPALAQSVASNTQGAAPAPATARVHHHRMTMNERFTAANTTHDGHLTLDQAKTGYRTVARHFAAIDTGHKGYVTEDDIRAWEKAQRARHHVMRQQSSAQSKG